MALKNIWTLISNVKSKHFPVPTTYNCVRLFSISSIHFLKEIRKTETPNQIVIEGVKVKSDREGKVINLPNRKGCPLCRVGLKNLKHTDILILNQFINSDGSVIPQYITGLCKKQHFKVVRAVALAQRAGFAKLIVNATKFCQNACGDCFNNEVPRFLLNTGLIPKTPGTPLFGDWEKYNTYFKKY